MKKIGMILVMLAVSLFLAEMSWANGAVCEQKLFGADDFKVYACDIKKDTSGVKAPIKNACYYFDMGDSPGDFGYYAERPRDAEMGCSCEPTGFNTIVPDASIFFLCLGAAHNPNTENYEPAGFRGKDVWKVKCKIDNKVCPQETPT